MRNTWSQSSSLSAGKAPSRVSPALQTTPELRQHALEMESALKHLEEALKKRDQELELLRQALLDDQPAGVLAPGAEGWDKTL